MRPALRKLGACAGACLVVCALAPALAGAALSPGQIVVVDGKAYGGCGSVGCGGLIKVDPATGAESELSANSMPINSGSQLFNAPFALALDPAGDIIAIVTSGLGGSCVQGCGGVIRINPNTGQESLVSSNTQPVNASSQYFYQPTGVTVDAAGNILVSDWGYCAGCGKVIRVDPATGKQTLISSNTLPINASSRLFDYAQGLALDHHGNILVANASTHTGQAGNIVEVNPATGKETELSGNDMPVNASSQYLWAPVNLVVDAAGNLLVADWGHHPGGTGDVVKIDPTTGKQTLLSANSLPVNASSQYFDGPVGITLDRQGNIIVADESAFGPCSSTSCGGVIRVDPASGRETKISANDMPVNSSNRLFVQPFDVLVVPAAGGGGGSGGGGSGGGGGGGGGITGQAPVKPHLRSTIDRRHHRAKFTFTDPGASRFRCAVVKLGRHAKKRPRPRFSACSSPKSYKNLADGHYEFFVRGLNSAGRAGQAATKRFTI